MMHSGPKDGSGIELPSLIQRKGDDYQLVVREEDVAIESNSTAKPSSRRRALVRRCAATCAFASPVVVGVVTYCALKRTCHEVCIPLPEPLIGYPASWCSRENNKTFTFHDASDNEPNPPNWPASVLIFNPSQSSQEIMKLIAQTEDPTIAEIPPIYRNRTNATKIFTHTSKHHFSNERWALLFEPGDYRGLDFEVGYYVQVMGLGSKADRVKFLECAYGPHVPSLDKTRVHVPFGLGLDTFWRAGENFYTQASQGQQWVVSQASPLRRVHVAMIHNNDTVASSGSLHLSYQDAWVSGGVLANSVIEGPTDFGGQQQWLSRNVDFRGQIQGGAWSIVFVGCQGAVPEPSGGSTTRPSVSVEKIPRVRVEKPYIAVENGRYKLRIPQPTMGHDAVGPDLNGEKDKVRDFSRVKVARADRDDTSSMQMALDDGKDLVLAPGIYSLTTSLKVKHPDQVLLGIGLATLVAPTDGSPCIRVLPKTPGVRVAGVMLEASKQDLEIYYTETRDACDGVASLLEWGYANANDPGDPTNPGVLTDVFARVGGSSLDRTVSTNVMVRIHSGNVLGDNLWLWRADHSKLHPGEEPNYPATPKTNDWKLPRVSDSYHQTVKDECKCANGLIVNGNDVTIHGLAVEHTEENQVIWNGDRGQVCFYQSELPYDVTHASFGRKGYVGYHVDDAVQSHHAMGAGVYSNFRDYTVQVTTAIRHPRRKGINFVNPFTVLLDNYGTISSVINGHGNQTAQKGVPVRVEGRDASTSSTVCGIFS